jgi:hypothetical protein
LIFLAISPVTPHRNALQHHRADRQTPKSKHPQRKMRLKCSRNRHKPCTFSSAVADAAIRRNIFSRAASRDQTAVSTLIFEAHLKNRKAHVIL